MEDEVGIEARILKLKDKLVVDEDPRIDKTILFYCKIKKLLGIVYDRKIYILHCNSNDISKVKDPLFLYKSLNSKSLRNSIYIYSEINHNLNVPTEEFKGCFEISDTIDYETEFKNYEVNTEIMISPPPNHNISFSIKSFKLLFSNILELKDYSRIYLIKTINLKYYFRKLIKEDNINIILKDLKNNINKSLYNDKNIITNKNLDLNLLTYYNKLISPNSKHVITNTYLYGNNVKKFINLNNELINKLISVEELDLVYSNNKELLDNYIKNITNLLKIYYIEIYNIVILMKHSFGSGLKFDENKLISYYYKESNNQLKSNFTDDTLIKINTLVRHSGLIEEDIFKNVNLYLYDTSFKKENYKRNFFKPNSSLYVDLFKINIFNCEIKDLIVLLFILDKEMNSYYKTIDIIEKNITLIKNIK